MITKKDIEDILKINESYKLTDRLLKVLPDKEERERTFDEFIKREQDLSFDWFTNYFQEEQGDRKSLKQDYTPNCLCEIVSRLCNGENNIIADICAGTGGLTIKVWNNNKNAFFHCEELSQRAISILLFNLSIRNINGQVVHGNALTGEIDTVYSLKKTSKYSEITEVKNAVDIKADVVISNPPYSLQWNNVDDYKNDCRFEKYGLPPKSKADYGFVLHSLSKLKENGTIIEILPHGVLFRGGREAQIRQKLIEDNLLDAVIELPDKLFLSTSIPVTIMVFQKGRKESDVLVIDASKDFLKDKSHNYIDEEQINRIIDAYQNRKEVENYAHIATFKEIEENEFNLNIPRYVDVYESEPVPDLLETITEMHKIDMEIQKLDVKLLKMMKQLVGTTAEADKKLKKAVAAYERYVKSKYGGIDEQITMEFEI